MSGCLKNFRKLSSFEMMLIECFLLLLALCVGLLIFSWLAIRQPKALDIHNVTNQSSQVSSGSFKITQGASYTTTLQNKSSLQFKALAFEVEHLVQKIFMQSELRDQYKNCEVLQFKNGTVIVLFNLYFFTTVPNIKVKTEMLTAIETNQGSYLGKFRIDTNSIQITDFPAPGESTTQQPPSKPTPTKENGQQSSQQVSQVSTPGHCLPGNRICADGITCIDKALFCNGKTDCPDSSDEDEQHCATPCDGKFLLTGTSGSFHSINFPKPYNPNTVCQWIIRVEPGFYIQVSFTDFKIELSIDYLDLYQGTGSSKELIASLTGFNPGSVRIFSNEATAEFWTDEIQTSDIGFNATFTVFNINVTSNQEKVNCSFENGFCYWRQDLTAEGEWDRINGPTYPPLTGPNDDHTYGNESGYYIMTPFQPFHKPRKIRLLSPMLSVETESSCLTFWYYMYGIHVSRLRVYITSNKNVSRTAFQKEGNYGNQWNYGQLTINETDKVMVVFEAIKDIRQLSEIALDDISLTNGICKDSGYPEPTAEPKPTTPIPGPTDCGGPLELTETNTTFSSMNYPKNYMNNAFCTWYLIADKGKNIQLHFEDFNLENIFDVLEVRDGRGEDSLLMGVYTGHRVLNDLFSTRSEMTVFFTSDKSVTRSGFQANFTTGFHLDLPAPCAVTEHQCKNGLCISKDKLCNGHRDCKDGSDEKHCVRLLNGSRSSDGLVQFNLKTEWHSICIDNFSENISNALCVELGFRNSSKTSPISANGTESFVKLDKNSNGSYIFVPSTKCYQNKVVYLNCNRKPCGKSLGEPQGLGKIVGGKDAVEGTWPWIVSLHFGFRHVCGATLISEQWIVSAAHCVYGRNLELSNWKAILGLHTQFNLTTPHTQIRGIDRILMNPHYNKRKKDSDIALMHLISAVTYTGFVQPVCLPDRNQHFLTGMRCYIAGWGALSENGPPPNVLQDAVVPLISNQECQDQLPQYNITGSMVCAGYEKGGVDTCKGDSGGPLVCKQDSQWCLAGITSFGHGCGLPRSAGVYVRVTKFVEWMQEIINFYTN
ncbi:enteropeptidase [Stegostoma tigrinum]|uniref:enteropeptidase n=1 Tax=Stegostoma tigrinum TaxID=3053191 RepID=UPI00202B0F72|nr:enteropeptidase [Stegostoma tigrinum]